MFILSGMFRQGLVICFSVVGLSVACSCLGPWLSSYIGFNMLVLINLILSTYVLAFVLGSLIGTEAITQL